MINNETIERLTAVRAQLSEWQVDGILIGSGSNRRWLSGFTGSAGYLLVTAEKALLATDFRYWEQALAQSPDFTLVRHNRSAEADQEFLATAGVQIIGLEADHLSLSEAERWAKAAENVAWVHLSPTLEPLRWQKSAAELEAIRAAAAITDAAMAQVPHLARPGMTERALAWELEKLMREAGAEAMAFDILVASGPNSALPHHKAGERPLQPNDPLIVDMGAQVDGYKSDLTRTFFLGEPDAQFRAVYELVLAAQTAVFQHARPGQNGNEVDAHARSVIQAAGHGDHFGHGLGHGVGLDIHEGPFFSYTAGGANYTLKPGMVVTVEPGVYLPGWGGIRLEELTLATAEGLQALSHCPKEPGINI